MKSPTHGPAYVGFYPALAELVNARGYALAVHGSLHADFDLVAVPWNEQAVAADDLIRAIADRLSYATDSTVSIDDLFKAPYCSVKPCGRRAWSIPLSCGAVLDISVMPRDTPDAAIARALVQKTHEIEEIHRQYGCELQDPAGTIWEHAANVSADNLRLRATLKLARAQYMGCGGNLSAHEVVDAIHRVLDEALAAPRVVDESSPGPPGPTRVGDRTPPRGTFVVRRGERYFTAKPCYGMHHPWWVVQLMPTGWVAEAESVNMEDDDEWWPLDEFRPVE